MSRIYVQTWQDTYLKAVRMPFAGEEMEVEIYGWPDASPSWQ